MASVQHDPLLEEEVMHNHDPLDVGLDSRYVAVTGDTMTGTLNFSSAGITNAESVTYDITQTRTPIEGEAIWNNDAKTLEIGLKGGFPLEIGLQQVELCVNKTGSSISKGKVVYINGGQGNRPTITLADNSTDATSARTFGVTVEAINDNNSGYVVSTGIVIGLDTNAYTAGTQLYLSTNGDMTSTKPVAPAHMVYVAKVLTQSTTDGAIYVGVMNGFEIDELHDVLITSLANKDTIAYDSTSSLWKNKSLATLKTDLDLTGTNSGDVTVTDTSTIDFTLTGQALTGSVIEAGITHNNLGGLTTGDPHTQYALLAGRSGGQSLSGGTAANDDLTLQGTTNATRTTSYVLLQPNGGNVGIGTTAPSAELEVQKNQNASTYIKLTNTDNTNTTSRARFALQSGTVIQEMQSISTNGGYFGTTSNHPFYIYTNGNTQMTVLSNGNVGIGTTSPVSKLDVRGQIAGQSWLNLWNTGAVGTLAGGQEVNGDEKRAAITFGGSDDARGWYLGQYENSTAANTALGFYKWSGTGTGWHMILKDGNVGIGTVAPSAQLHVDQTSTTAAKPTLRLQQADLSEEFIRFDTTVGTGNPTNTSALGTYYGRVRVYVEGVGAKWLALYNT